tara:strand:- start:105 stop:1799 length:1695 start_codon:yes stop_codon:yes gene_type:complete
MISGIVICLFYSHAASLKKPPASLTTLPLLTFQNALPQAARFGAQSSHVRGAIDLLDVSGEAVGFCFQTSPASDTVIGFSGPSNMLIICDARKAICGIEILSSGDTRDHVSVVTSDKAFWSQFLGKTPDELKRTPDKPYMTSAGATLTSLAMIEALNTRLGKVRKITRFSDEPQLEEIQKIFPKATQLRPDAGDSSIINVYDHAGIPLGWTLRTSPAADSIIGYQGPTDSLIGFDSTGTAVGLCIRKTFDNEPYVSYVRDDIAFKKYFIGQTFEEIASTENKNSRIEGVSGATMTSQAIAEAIVVASQSVSERHSRQFFGRDFILRIQSLDAPQWGAIFIIFIGLIIGYTRLRGHWVGRIVLPLLVLTYLGFGSGALLSQAQLWGWAIYGIPQGATVLLLLSLLAVGSPAATGRNIYCNQLCAHGAAQQLLKITIPNQRFRVLKDVQKSLGPLLQHVRWLPWTIFISCALLSIFDMKISLVDFEPFDAYLPTVAGTSAIVICIVGLAISSLSPMAYCRYGCPTGAMLRYVRLHRQSGRITWQDVVLCGCFAMSLAMAVASGAFT